MFERQCFGIVAENTCGQRFKLLATEIAFSELNKGLQLLKYNIYNENKDVVQKSNKLSSQKFENELFLKSIDDIQKHFNNLCNAYISGQSLSEILDSLRPISNVEQVDEPLDSRNIKENYQSIISSTSKKVDNPLKLWIENEYLERHFEIKVNFAMYTSERVEQDLINEINQYKTRISNESRCFQNINQTHYEACKLFKLRFEEKNQEYEDEYNFYEDEINEKRMQIDKLKYERTLLNKEIVRFHEEIDKVRKKIKTQKSVAFPVSKYVGKNSPQKISSKYENMKNFENRKFRVKAKQTIKGKLIKEALKMDMQETF